jgi:hypothetical protein
MYAGQAYGSSQPLYPPVSPVVPSLTPFSHHASFDAAGDTAVPVNSSQSKTLASLLPVCCQFQFVVPSNMNSRVPNTEVHPQAGSPPFTYPVTPQSNTAFNNPPISVFAQPLPPASPMAPVSPEQFNYSQSFGMSTGNSTLPSMMNGSGPFQPVIGVAESQESSVDESASVSGRPKPEDLMRKKSVTMVLPSDNDFNKSAQKRQSALKKSTRSNPGSERNGPTYKREASSPVIGVSESKTSPQPPRTKSLASRSSSSLNIRKSEKNQNIRAKDRSDWEKGNSCCVCKQKFGLFSKSHHCRKW